MLKKGQVQIYTGDGKGKTTAALGLAVRAAGAGLKVMIYQFLKPRGSEISERKALSKTNLNIRIEALDYQWDMAKSFKDPEAISEVKLLIKKALNELTKGAEKADYDVIILDEIVFCYSKGLAELAEIEKLIKKRNKSVEIVMTGRGAGPELIELADLVSEINPVKHPYNKGIAGRKGIEF